MRDDVNVSVSTMTARMKNLGISHLPTLRTCEEVYKASDITPRTEEIVTNLPEFASQDTDAVKTSTNQLVKALHVDSSCFHTLNVT